MRIRESLPPEGLARFIENVDAIKANSPLLSAYVLGVVGIDGTITVSFASDRTVDLGGLMFLLDMQIKDYLLDAGISTNEDDDE